MEQPPALDDLVQVRRQSKRELPSKFITATLIVLAFFAFLFSFFITKVVLDQPVNPFPPAPPSEEVSQEEDVEVPSNGAPSTWWN